MEASMGLSTDAIASLAPDRVHSIVGMIYGRIAKFILHTSEVRFGGRFRRT